MKTLALNTENRKLVQIGIFVIGVPVIKMVEATRHLQGVEVAGFGIALFATILLVYVLHESNR